MGFSTRQIAYERSPWNYTQLLLFATSMHILGYPIPEVTWFDCPRGVGAGFGGYRASDGFLITSDEWLERVDDLVPVEEGV